MTKKTQPTDAELMPCPFCGGINIIHCGHHMYCHACGADGPDADTQYESDALAAWNRRTPQPVVREPLTVDEVEQLIAQWSYEVHGDRARYLVRMTEQHHGIKGGQHGTE